MNRITEEMKDQVVDLYNQGERVDDITATTGVKRPTIYYVLRQRGLRPTRTARNIAGPDLAELMAQLNAAQREIGRIEQQRDSAYRLLGRIVRSVGDEDPAMGEVIAQAVEAAGIPSAPPKGGQEETAH